MCLALIAGEGCRMERFAARFVRIPRSPHCHQPVYRSEPSPRSPLMPPRAPTSLESLPSSWAPWLSRGSSPQKSRKVLWEEAKARTQECVHLAGLLRQPVAAQKLRPALEPRLA